MADKLISLETLRKEVERNFDMQDLYLPVHFFDVAEDVARKRLYVARIANTQP